jgi:hypothetical protein
MAVKYRSSGRGGGGARSLVLGLSIGLAVGMSMLSLLARHTTTTTTEGSLPISTAQQAAPAGRWRRPEATLPREVYSLGVSTDQQATEAVASLLSEGERRELRELCGRTLYHSLQTGWVSHETGAWTFVATGEPGLLSRRQACSWVAQPWARSPQPAPPPHVAALRRRSAADVDTRQRGADQRAAAAAGAAPAAAARGGGRHASAGLLHTPGSIRQWLRAGVAAPG